ncbi:MAG: SGNH/GDSL hydrolase family protein [Liquorilactobacillus sp.]|uniref:SGNH/GDSL hydrolase family protein n=2 Tax=Liquorilactobacillus sp. TaxID=2767923 RepID=UPI0039E7BC56
MNKIIKNLVPVIVCCILGLIFYLLFSFVFGSNETKVNQRTDSSSKQAASKQTKQKKKIRLVALGDSLTQGVGDTTNKGGYVHLIQEKLKKNNKLSVATENFGKAGDRSDQILERLKKSASMQKQLSNADVIVLTVGGNDLMQTLQKNFTSLSSADFTKVMASAEKVYTDKLNKLLQSVRIYNAKAPVFIYSVYNPFYVYFPRLTQLQKYTNEWNNVTLQVIAKKRNIYMVQINKQLSEGQYLGKTSQLKTTTVTDLDKLNGNKLTQIVSNKEEKNNYLSSADHFHPNLKGYNYMTERLYAVMMKHKKTWLNEVNN